LTAHALLSASSSKRWLTCTPSARLEATLPEPKRNAHGVDFSAEGTLAHSLSEIRLKLHYNQITEEKYAEEYAEIQAHIIYKTYSPEEKLDFEANVDNYVLYVRSQIGEGDTPLFEQRVDFSEWVPDGFGTADVVILSERSIRVIDLKFGKGIPVNAKDNSQLRLYGLGAWSKFSAEYPNIQNIQYTIHQPRLDSISTDETTVGKLIEWAQYFVKPKAKKAWSGSGEFIPGDHCQFCKAKSQCRARADFNNDLAKLEFRDPPLLTDDELSEVLSKAQNLKSWVGDIEDYALERAIEKNIVPSGYQLSTTKTHRKIMDTALAAVILKERNIPVDDIFEPQKLKSLAQLEKINKNISAWLGDLIERPTGSPKLIKLKEDAKEDFA